MGLPREIANKQTKFSCIKRKARENPGEVFTSLAHYLTEEHLLTSFRKLRKNAASGMDKVTAREYGLNILQRIENLHTRLKNGKSLQVGKNGTPQGNIISPLPCNVYLHYVLDKWLQETVRPLLKGEMFVIRHADDFIIGFGNEGDAIKVTRMLPKRMGKYGLTVHPEKSRLVKHIN